MKEGNCDTIVTQVRKAKKFEASKDALMVNTIFAND